jgi:hypothetical protein
MLLMMRVKRPPATKTRIPTKKATLMYAESAWELKTKGRQVKMVSLIS